MAVVSMMRMSGDPSELAQKLEGIADVGRRLAPKHGGLGTIAAKTDDGILVINLWENEEGRHAMAEEPEVLEALQSSGLPMPNFEGYEVVDMRILPEAVRGG
jgi:hypothetical protein